jgi:hypothetical protein
MRANRHNPNFRHQAQRTGLYAESKLTNWRPFNPAHAEVWRVYYHKYYDDFQSAESEPIIRIEPIAKNFIMPISETDIRSFLTRVPVRFVASLRGILLLGGSHQQYKVRNSRTFCYGCYYQRIIFINPFPMGCITEKYKYCPPPHIRHEYERAGANFSKSTSGWVLEWPPEALHRYYLYNVLTHELGHHVDWLQRNGQDRATREAESFAEWFVREFGYKLIRQDPSC